jgi:predicted dehydrogenase
MENTRRVKAAVVGVGLIGEQHADVYHEYLRSDLVLVTDLDLERARTVAGRLGCRVAETLDDVANSDAEVVSIATPDFAHHEPVMRMIEAGKHVVVEKPLAPTLAEARALVSLAAESRRVLAAFHNRRWDGDFTALRGVLESGVLGEVAQLESHFDRYRPVVRDRWRERPGLGAGLWYDLGPHLVDQALQLFGLPDRIAGNLAAQRPGAVADDWAHVILEYGRRRVILHAAVVVASSPFRFAVHGLAGSWIKSGLDRQERRLVAALTPAARDTVQDEERAVLVDGQTGMQQEMPVPAGDYGHFYAQLRDALLGVGDNPVPPDQAVAVIAVVEAAVRSSADGRSVAPSLTPT